jgi:uncharacterized membrane protein
MDTTSSTTLNTRRIVIAGVLSAIAILLGWTRIGYIPVPNLAANATIMHVPAIIGGVLEGWLVGGIVGLIFGLSSFALATIPLFKNPLIAIVPRLFIGVTAYLAYRAIRQANERVMLAVAALGGALITIFITVLLRTPSQALGDTVVHMIEQGASADEARRWFDSLLLQQDLVLILAALVGGGVAVALAYLALRVSGEYLALVIAAVVGTLTNTVLVLGLAGLFNYIPWSLMPPILLTNALPEIIVAVILVVAVVTAFKRIETGTREARM